MTLSFWMLCMAGFSLHFLLRYRTAWRENGKLSPLAFVLLDPIGWACSLIMMFVLPYIIQEVGPMLGMSFAPLSPLGAFACGYMASSVATKLPSLLSMLLPKKLQE